MKQIPTTYQDIIDRASGAAARRLQGMTFGDALPLIDGQLMHAVSRWQWRGEALRSLTVIFLRDLTQAENETVFPFSLELCEIDKDAEEVTRTLRHYLVGQYLGIAHARQGQISDETNQGAGSPPAG